MNDALNAKLHQTAALVARFQNRPNKNGARNAPAKAPHETLMSCAINAMLWPVVFIELYCTVAISADTAINTKINPRIITICFFSPIFLITCPFKKSNVNVDDDTKTNEDRVEIEAAKTSSMTSPTRTSGNFSTILGMILSNICFNVSLYS